MQRVRYEWLIEEHDAGGDIFNVDHPDSFADCIRRTEQYLTPGRWQIGLTRESQIDGWWDNFDRQWAYIQEDGRLSEFFDDKPWGHKVPKRFHREVEKSINSA